jgi:zinc protease
MWKTLLIVSGLVAIMLTLVACQGPKDKQVVEFPVKTDPTVSFRIWFQVGSQNDPAGKEGLAALTASMLAKAGTEQNSYDQILEKLYPMAAGYSASVDKEMTVISGRVHKDNLDAYVQLLTEAVLNPAFRQEDFDRIKTNTLNTLDKSLRYANDEAFGKEALYQFIFEGTHYGHPDAGLIESVESITLEHVKSFYQTFFTRDKAVIGIGGGYDKTLVQQLKDRLAELPPSVITSVARSVPESIDGIEVRLVEKETESTAISMGFPIDVHRGDRDFYALWIANSWFGEHRNSSSHLYQVIREARGMNYGDYSYIECFPDGWERSFPEPNAARRQQIFEIWIRPVQNRQAHFAVRAALRELKKLVDGGMTQEDFELTCKFLKKYHLNYAPTTSDKLGYKLDDAFYGIDDHLKTLDKMLDDLTLEEVNAAIKKHLQYKNLKIAMITQGAKSLKNALVNDKRSPMEYASPKSGEILDEDLEIESFNLDIDKNDVEIVKADEMFVK